MSEANFPFIEPDWIYLTTTELEKLIPGATIALGILYFGKWSEKLPTGAIEANFPFIEPDWSYLTTTELEKLIPGATIALGILYFGKRSEKLPTGAVKLPTGVLKSQRFQERKPKYFTLAGINFIESANRREHWRSPIASHHRLI